MEELNKIQNINIEEIEFLVYYIKSNNRKIGTILCETGNDCIYIEFEDNINMYEYYNIYFYEEKEKCKNLIKNKLDKLHNETQYTG